MNLPCFYHYYDAIVYLKYYLQGYFKVNPWFFVAMFAHIFFFQVAAWWVLWYFGNSWITWIISAVCVVTAQAQAGWLQHDFGHHTVFNSTRLNHLFHDISIGLMKVTSLVHYSIILHLSMADRLSTMCVTMITVCRCIVS